MNELTAITNNWYWTHKVIERLFEFVWLHPAWTIFFLILLFSSSNANSKGGTQ
jgi:hypothetical protein